MNALSPIASDRTLPALIAQAASMLSSAVNAAEILEARDMARVAYDAAKSASRFAKVKQAHDDVLSAVYRAQADALEIEAGAKRRLADEYDAAQDRGEIATRADNQLLPDEKKPGVADLGLTHKDIHEARLVRDAELAEPGIVQRVVREQVERREEPTKAALREAVIEAAKRGLRSESAPVRKNPDYRPDPAWTAMASLTGSCRTISELLGRYEPAFIFTGFTDTAMRARNLRDIERARDGLSELLELADAE